MGSPSSICSWSRRSTNTSTTESVSPHRRWRPGRPGGDHPLPPHKARLGTEEAGGRAGERTRPRAVEYGHGYAEPDLRTLSRSVVHRAPGTSSGEHAGAVGGSA